jgi:hypothetical protein
MTEDRIVDAIALAQSLLQPEQQPPPEDLSAILNEAIGVAERGDLSAAVGRCRRAVERGRSLGYL